MSEFKSKTISMVECRLENLEFMVKRLRRMSYYQHSYVIGLEDYVTSRISELAGTEQGREMARAIYAFRRAYDEQISRMENDSPALAAEMDVRTFFSKEGQDEWYFPSDPSLEP
jgi:hypothetical protein